MDEGLKFGDLGESCVHLCVDMQRMFGEGTQWSAPWMKRVLPMVRKIVEKAPERSVFTRFIPAAEPGIGQGAWKRYYERWSTMTLANIDQDLIELLPELAKFVPPAHCVNKHVYAPWMETDLHRWLRQRNIDTLVISGCETEICVLATVMGAIDLGYRVVLATDALCSSADETHDAMMRIYDSRFGMQVELAPTDVIVEAWHI
jgi:nicotinamidase-related amidase